MTTVQIKSVISGSVLSEQRFLTRRKAERVAQQTRERLVAQGNINAMGVRVF